MDVDNKVDENKKTKENGENIEFYEALYNTVYGNIELPKYSIELQWKNLTVYPKKSDRKLLDDISGKVSGKLLAVMGASGSGKTTFLNQLAMREKGLITSPDTKLMVSGLCYSRNEMKQISGYVMQQDILFENLTVYETLSYAAQLKMHPTATSNDRNRRIERILKLLGIEECRDVVVGSPFVTGISGGQRKRLAVGVELITR